MPFTILFLAVQLISMKIKHVYTYLRRSLVAKTKAFFASIWLLRLVMLCILSLLWWSLSLPLYVDVILVVLLMLLCINTSIIHIFLVMLSFVFSICVINFFLQFSYSQANFYREHERYTLGEYYQPNIDADIRMPHGDLVALDPNFPFSLYEPRRVTFKTDSLGYRNSSEYRDRSHVLVGDSFVVGNGISQEETLPEVLLKKYNFNAYSIAFPGASVDYGSRVKKFLTFQNPNADFSFFFFEGNDFTGGGDPLLLNNDKLLPPYLSKILISYDDYRINVMKRMSFLTYPRLLYGFSRKLERLYIQRTPSSVIIRSVGGITMGLYVPWALTALSPSPAIASNYDKNILQHTKCVFFIPDKYRVYRDLFDSKWNTDPAPLKPAPSFKLLEALYRDYPAKVVDLTPILANAALKHLENRKLVFWKDDTHWNSLGIESVAEAIHGCMAQPVVLP
jgi:hypothetical protein